MYSWQASTLKTYVGRSERHMTLNSSVIVHTSLAPPLLRLSLGLAKHWDSGQRSITPILTARGSPLLPTQSKLVTNSHCSKCLCTTNCEYDSIQHSTLTNFCTPQYPCRQVSRNFLEYYSLLLVCNCLEEAGVQLNWEMFTKKFVIAFLLCVFWDLKFSVPPISYAGS
jgi:hypothetical protein